MPRPLLKAAKGPPPATRAPEGACTCSVHDVIAGVSICFTYNQRNGLIIDDSVYAKALVHVVGRGLMQGTLH